MPLVIKACFIILVSTDAIYCTPNWHKVVYHRTIQTTYRHDTNLEQTSLVHQKPSYHCAICQNHCLCSSSDQGLKKYVGLRMPHFCVYYVKFGAI